MTARNGKIDHKPKPGPTIDVAQVKPGGGMPAKSVNWLERRTAAFVEMTSGAGKPMSYGHGKPPSGQSADKPRSRA